MGGGGGETVCRVVGTFYLFTFSFFCFFFFSFNFFLIFMNFFIFLFYLFIYFFSFFLYARLKNGRIMLYPSASVRLSVRPSVNFFVSV